MRERRVPANNDTHNRALELLEAVFNEYSATEIVEGAEGNQFVRLVIAGALSQLSIEEILKLTGTDARFS